MFDTSKEKILGLKLRNWRYIGRLQVQRASGATIIVPNLESQTQIRLFGSCFMHAP